VARDDAPASEDLVVGMRSNNQDPCTTH
jgi:hypothetical protein